MELKATVSKQKEGEICHFRTPPKGVFQFFRDFFLTKKFPTNFFDSQETILVCQMNEEVPTSFDRIMRTIRHVCYVHYRKLITSTEASMCRTLEHTYYVHSYT